MTNAIDLDEPHLKREGMIQGRQPPCKGSDGRHKTTLAWRR